MKRGYKLITDGTDNHIVLMSCIDKGLTGSKMENACEKVHITLNKNTIIGDLNTGNFIFFWEYNRVERKKNDTKLLQFRPARLGITP